MVTNSLSVLVWGFSMKLCLSTSSILCILSVWQHPFITSAKPVTILRDLITEAMEMKVKRQQEQQRELEEDDENSVSCISVVQFTMSSAFVF